MAGWVQNSQTTADDLGNVLFFDGIRTYIAAGNYPVDAGLDAAITADRQTAVDTAFADLGVPAGSKPKLVSFGGSVYEAWIDSGGVKHVEQADVPDASTVPSSNASGTTPAPDTGTGGTGGDATNPPDAANP